MTLTGEADRNPVLGDSSMSVKLGQVLAQPQRNPGMVDPQEQMKVLVVERPIGC